MIRRRCKQPEKQAQTAQSPDGAVKSNEIDELSINWTPQSKIPVIVR